uniref:Receptor protein-tyrosine kinase n=1 Tax=Branchiostoma floridae TaxID=7739 RepID=C3ZRN6_BRAFL|eukprot:XP_002588825.1 hypothetical protein BRAFLDRAFT_89744 [Branchiostoma floridae]
MTPHSNTYIQHLLVRTGVQYRCGQVCNTGVTAGASANKDDKFHLGRRQGTRQSSSSMQRSRVTCRAAAVSVLGLLWVVMITAAFTCPETCSCGSNEQVYCIRRGLTVVPANIPLGTTVLYLDFNNIQDLSDADFGYLTRLELLDLSYNHIADLPDGVFSNLTSLVELLLHNNNISSLPTGVFSHLTSLRYLWLSDNHIADLPDGVFSHLTSLEQLFLEKNIISSLPTGVFSHLTRLVVLLMENNDISSLPSGVFSHLTSLFSLSLSGNHIADLPDGVFSNLTSLRDLYLHNNNISSLPTGVFSHLTSLGLLYLSGNHIADLPHGVFSNLTSLLQLHLHNNNISSLPTGVFSHLTSLGLLYLSGNHIADLPDGVFSHLTNLGVLHLENNNISSLPSGVFSRLTRLVRLHLDNNNISSLPSGVFSHLTSLQNLYIAGNPWRCDCSIHGLLTSARLRTSISDGPTCSSPHHMKGDALKATVTVDKVCLGRGDCTMGSADVTCACNVGWTGPFCGKGKLMVRVGPNENFTQNDQCGQSYDVGSALQFLNIEAHCDPPMYGRYVSVQAIPPVYRKTTILAMCEVEVYVTDICCDGTISIQNGKVTDTNGYCSGNEKIQFSCDPGYELAGKPSATCLKNGSWDAETPTCQRSCCNNTISITNGHITASNGYCSGNSIHFSCDVGYKLVGSSSAICQVDKHWDREIPTCQRICCDNTTEIINGLVNATDGYCFGNDMQFSCNPGYELVGRSLATCEDDGSWGREFPICRQQSLAFTQAIIGGTSAGITTALIVAAVFFMVFLRQRRRKRREDYQQPIELDFLPDDVAIHRRRMEEMVQLVPPRPQFPKLEVDPSRVTLGQRIGSGAFGLVYRAILTRDDRTEDVVVKTVKENASEDDKLSFLEEIRAVVDLGAHKNLLGLVNCCTVVRDHLYLITEFMPYGDLKSFLRKCREEENSDGPRDDIYNFEVMQMFQVARQIAGGMDHIARSRYVHGDLAARNVLVGERLKVKISDFGLAENIYQRGYRRQDRLQKVPVKWMAPERLQGGEAYTTQSDVWSYGIVLYEICTLGDHPYPDVAVRPYAAVLALATRLAPVIPYTGGQNRQESRLLRARVRQTCPTLGRHSTFYGSEYNRPTLDRHPAFYGPEYNRPTLDRHSAFYGPEYNRPNLDRHSAFYGPEYNRPNLDRHPTFYRPDYNSLTLDRHFAFY